MGTPVKKADGGPAFPTDVEEAVKGSHLITELVHYPGISIRDYFAAQALKSLIAAVEQDDTDTYGVIAEAEGTHVENYVARRAYDYADAMLEERKK